MSSSTEAEGPGKIEAEEPGRIEVLGQRYSLSEARRSRAAGLVAHILAMSIQSFPPFQNEAKRRKSEAQRMTPDPKYKRYTTMFSFISPNGAETFDIAPNNFQHTRQKIL